MTVDVLFFHYITRVNNVIDQIWSLCFLSIIFRIYVKYNVTTMPSTYATSMDFVHMNKLWKLTMHVTLMKIKCAWIIYWIKCHITMAYNVKKKTMNGIHSLDKRHIYANEFNDVTRGLHLRWISLRDRILSRNSCSS